MQHLGKYDNLRTQHNHNLDAMKWTESLHNQMRWNKHFMTCMRHINDTGTLAKSYKKQYAPSEVSQ